MNTITALPVERDQYGYWTHPLYDEFCDGRESITSEEFNAWLDKNGLAWTVVYRDEDDIDPRIDGYDISTWQPEPPAGEGWFVGSIHDTEDGAVCIWLRHAEYALCFTSAGHSLPDDIYNLYVAPQPAKGLELAGWQFKSVNGDWLGLIDEHGKNQAVREGCEVREVFAMADGVNERDQVRQGHAEWSQATFGNVGPIGPLKHLSKEALEAAAEPGDLSEWADMQFLLWDAQRRAGITDEQITQAMIEKLAVNKQRDWPEPKDGEPRLHIKEHPAPVVPDGLLSMAASAIEDLLEHTDPNTSYYSGVWADVPGKLRAAMIAAAPQDEAKKDKPHNNFGTGARLTNHRFKV